MFGALPVSFQAFERAAYAFVRDGAGDDALLEADLGCQLQGPPPALFAKVARTAMQEVFQAHESVLREAGVQPMGARGAFLQHREPRRIELVHHIAHRLVVAAQLVRNRWGSFPACRCSQDLAATHHKGIGRTQSRLDLMLLVLGQRSDKNGCSHAFYYTTLPTTSGGFALGSLFLAYLIVILAFATTYFILGCTVGPALSPLGSVVFSMTSFHGRGFFPGGITLDDPLTVLASLEAFIGLLIEVTFIATLTRHLFGG